MDVHPTKNGIYRYWSIAIYMINIYQHYNGLCNHLYITSQQIQQFWSIDHAQILAQFYRKSQLGSNRLVDFHPQKVLLYVSVRYFRDFCKTSSDSQIGVISPFILPILVSYLHISLGVILAAVDSRGFHGDSTGPWWVHGESPRDANFGKFRLGATKRSRIGSWRYRKAWVNEGGTIWLWLT